MGIATVKLALATMTAVVSLFMAPRGDAETSIVDTGTHYCVDIGDSSLRELGLTLSACKDKPTQQFTVEEQTDGYALIKNNLRDTCLSISPNGTPAGSSVTMMRCDTVDLAQMFKPIPQGEGYALLSRRAAFAFQAFKASRSGPPVCRRLREKRTLSIPHAGVATSEAKASRYDR